MRLIHRAAAALLVTTAALPAPAQEAPPAAAPADDAERPVFLFVQSARSGTLEAVEGQEGRYVLTLRGVAPKTIYFSDRPLRIAGQADLEAFLAGLGFDDDNPPNAALELLGSDESGDVAVLELREPRYDAAAGTLTYDVTLLRDVDSGAPAFFAERADAELPAQFDECALFIDDCPDGTAFCFAVVDYSKGYADPHGSALGSVPFGQCWEWGILKCFMCDGQEHRIGQRCRDKFGSRCGDKCRGCVPRTTSTGGGGAIVTYDCY
jgi:hypothetical protein